MKKFRNTIIPIIILFLMFPLICIAHPGRTDSNGGHYNHSTGEYHYHNGESQYYNYSNSGTSKSPSRSFKSVEKAEKKVEEKDFNIPDENSKLIRFSFKDLMLFFNIFYFGIRFFCMLPIFKRNKIKKLLITLADLKKQIISLSNEINNYTDEIKSIVTFEPTPPHFIAKENDKMWLSKPEYEKYFIFYKSKYRYTLHTRAGCSQAYCKINILKSPKLYPYTTFCQKCGFKRNVSVVDSFFNYYNKLGNFIKKENEKKKLIKIIADKKKELHTFVNNYKKKLLELDSFKDYMDKHHRKYKKHYDFIAGLISFNADLFL